MSKENKNPEEAKANENQQPKSTFNGKGRNINPVARTVQYMNDDAYIKERLENQMNWFDGKASFNQKKYKYYQKRVFIISAAVPVLITISNWDFAIKLGIDAVGLNLSIALQALAAISGIFLAIFNKTVELEEYHKLWKDYRVCAESLKYNRYLYLTGTEPYDEEDAFPLLVENVEEILAKDVQKWRTPAKKSATPDEEKIEEKNDKK